VSTDKPPVYQDNVRTDSQAEAPNIVYGRLLESAHISGYGFERMTGELEWLLEGDRWQQVGPGYADVNLFLRSIDLSAFNLAEKKRLHQRIKELQPQASTRAIGKATGTPHRTVHNHVAVPNGTGDSNAKSTDQDDTERTAPNGTGEWFERESADVAGLAQGRARRLARDQNAAERRQERARKTVDAMTEPRNIDLRCGDFRKALSDVQPATIDAIITDPPYGKEWLPLLADLAQFAHRTLTDDGLLAILYGHTWLPEAFRLLEGSRPYRWTACYLMGGPAFSSTYRQVQSGWKPILVYGGGRRFDDVIRNADTNAAAKELHEWGQGLDGFITLVERLTEPGQTVCDPMMGAGTTLAAAHALGRHVIGCDVDAANVKRAKERIG